MRQYSTLSLAIAASISVNLLVEPSFAIAQQKDDIEEVTVEGRFLSIDEVNAVKTPTPIIDVPQSLSIITADQITEQGITSIGDIIDYTPGVNTSQGEGHRDAVVFRGVRSTADFYIDGNRDDVQYYRALYNVEQVEILRGPNALLFGRGGTGGILNRVAKKAEVSEQFTAFKTTANSFGGLGFELDYNVSSSETSAFRINAMYESLDNHRDFFDGDRFGINPTARFELSPATTLDLSYEYVDHERFIDRGIPTGADGRPVERLEDIVFTDPENSVTTLEAHIFRAALQHDFSDALKGNFSAFYGDYDKSYQNFFAVAFDEVTNVVDLDGYIDETDRQNLILSGNLVGEFDALSLGHTMIVGVEYIDTSSDQFRFNTFFDTTQDDVESFSATRPISLSGGVGINAAGQTTNVGFTDLNDDTRVNIDVLSLYIQDQIEITEQFDVLIGARFDSFDIEVFNAANGETRDRSDDEVSPRLGLIYKPQENVSVYVSYSESFLPRSGEQFANINGSNNVLDPDTFSNLEFGVKWDFNTGLSLTAALFENEQISPQVADADPSTLDVIDSDISGFELQLLGQINDAWSISANYSNLDGEIVERDGPTGRTPRELPENTLSVWNTFKMSDIFGFGLGATYQDESFINNSNSAVLPSYTRVDASAYYVVSENLRLQLNIENLTDELYFPNAHSTHQATVGAPINALLTVTGKF